MFKTLAFAALGVALCITPAWAASPCAGAGTVWKDFSEPPDALDFKPQLDITLPDEMAALGEVELRDALGGAVGKTRPVIDATSVFLAGRGGSALRPPNGIYSAVIIPPGANEAMFPSRPDLKTGRAGAILLLPEPAKADGFCAAFRAPGLLIHAGDPKDAQVLREVPSLVMTEKDLAQTIADLVALQNGDSRLVGRSYAEVMKKVQSIVLDPPFGPLMVDVEFRSRTAREVKRKARFGSAGPELPPPQGVPPAFPIALSASDLLELHRRVSAGWGYYLEAMMKRAGKFQKELNLLDTSLSTTDPGRRREALEKIAPEVAEMIAFVPEARGQLEDALAAGDVPPYLVADVKTWIVQMKTYEKQLKNFQHTVAGQVVLLKRIEERFYLDVAKELTAAPVQTPDCVLRGHVLNIPAFGFDLQGKKANLLGKALVYFIKDPGTPYARVNIKALLDIDDFRRVHREWVSEKIPASSCQNRFIDEHKYAIYADGAGGLNGKSNIRYESYWCGYFNYPCWKDWKTYSCTKKMTTFLFKMGDEAPIYVTTSANSAGYEIKLSGRYVNGTADLSPDTLRLPGTTFQDLQKTYGVKPSGSFFSENKDGLWMVLELEGAPKLTSALCALQTQIEAHGSEL